MAWKVKAEANQGELKNMDESLKVVDEQKRRMIFALGDAFYRNNKNNDDVDEAYRQQIDTINKLEYNSKIWTNRKLKLQGMRKCENCGNVLPYESAFCNKCGVKLEAVAEELVIIPEN